jgi:CO/xanthine dehydrogenase Mo-binding subunit
MALMRDTLDGLALEAGQVVHKPTGAAIALAALARFLPRDDRIALGEFLMPVARETTATGAGISHRLSAPHLRLRRALVRIEADELTGHVRVCDYVTVTDGGPRALAPGLRPAAHGGAAQGLGLALFEDFRLDDGRILTGDLSTYLIPTALDLPDMDSHAVEGCEDSGPCGLKGVGEVGMSGPVPAVAAALRHALGGKPSTTALRLLRRPPFPRSACSGFSPPSPEDRVTISFLLNGRPMTVDADPDARAVDCCADWAPWT